LGELRHHWHRFVLVAAVSCEIIMVEVWHKEHEKAVLQASKNTDTKQTALSTEVEVVVDNMLREYTHASLNRPAMQEKHKAQSAKSVETPGAAARSSHASLVALQS
jgi:hypothetical protein